MQLIKAFYNQTYTERYGGFYNETVRVKHGNSYNVTYVEKYWSVTPETLTILWSLTTALFIPGGMGGAFLGGILADKLGR